MSEPKYTAVLAHKVTAMPLDDGAAVIGVSRAGEGMSIGLSRQQAITLINDLLCTVCSTDAGTVQGPVPTRCGNPETRPDAASISAMPPDGGDLDLRPCRRIDLRVTPDHQPVMLLDLGGVHLPIPLPVSVLRTLLADLSRLERMLASAPPGRQ